MHGTNLKKKEEYIYFCNDYRKHAQGQRPEMFYQASINNCSVTKSDISYDVSNCVTKFRG